MSNVVSISEHRSAKSPPTKALSNTQRQELLTLWRHLYTLHLLPLCDNMRALGVGVEECKRMTTAVHEVKNAITATEVKEEVQA